MNIPKQIFYNIHHDLATSDRPGVTMHPAQPDMDFLTK